MGICRPACRPAASSPAGATHATMAAMIVRFTAWIIAVTRTPGARAYMDQALSPAGDDDDDKLELMTKTTGGRAAVAHVKKVAELTGAVRTA